MFRDGLAKIKIRIRDSNWSFGDKKPHFSFITAHYFWIIGATIIASILIFAVGRGDVAYIDALLFASGANTQAGLNSVDVNLLNTFQQVVIYIFSMLSCPITLHGSVVFLRLYWFEKRFQHWVRDARARRGTLSKSKSTARNLPARTDEERGVEGRNIIVVPRDGRIPRLTNDGTLVESDADGLKPPKPDAHGGSDTSDSNTVAGDPNSIELSGLSKIEEGLPEGQDHNADATNLERQISPTSTAPQGSLGHQATIQFADQLKKDDAPEEVRHGHDPSRTHAEHIAILERQRKADNDDTLRIPGPRETEQGLGPMRLDQSYPDESGHPMVQTRTYDSTLNSVRDPPHPIRERQATITIAEPEHRKRDEIADNAAAFGHTVEALRFRKPRIFNRGQRRYHEDDDDEGEPTPATRVKTIDTIRSFLTREREEMPYLSYNPTMGRNSNFVGLTLEQREELGGIEYRSLRTLALIILGYFWGFQILAFTFFLPWIRTSPEYSAIVREDGQSPTWWAFWTANSAFMDLGLTLTPDSMISFATSQYVLMIMTFFIIIGNTGFPVMLRFVIWVLSKLTPSGTGLWEELRFLLDHPRRCFTLLFPSGPTWWLFWILVILNVIDLVFFIVLDINAEVVSHLPVGTRIVNGLFQSASTRTAGFSSVSLSGLAPAMPVLYMVMMYISVFPIAISIRRTNVYEEKSLGVYYDKKDDDAADDPNAVSYVGTHLRRQLSFDLWYVALGFFIIAIAEGPKLQDGRFDLFAVLFEIVSAYGTVGLSIGVPNVDASLCSQFSVVGKLVIVAMMIRGRHRGLPYGLDRAVLLPSESRFEREAQDAEIVLVRTPTARTGRTSIDARRASSLPRPRSLSRTRDRNILSSLLHPGPVVPRAESHGHRRNTSATSHGLTTGYRLSQVQSQPIIDSDSESLARTGTREPRAMPRRAETEPVIHED